MPPFRSDSASVTSAVPYHREPSTVAVASGTRQNAGDVGMAMGAPAGAGAPGGFAVEMAVSVVGATPLAVGGIEGLDGSAGGPSATLRTDVLDALHTDVGMPLVGGCTVEAGSLRATPVETG